MRTKDMTTGNPIRLILAFAIPLFIGNIFQQVYSLVDTMIAGYNLGDSTIAAIGATSSIYNLIIYFASGLNSGYAILVTQSFGSHDREGFKRATATMAVLNVAGAALATVIAQICSAVFCGGYIWKNYRKYLPKKEHFRLDRGLRREMLSTGLSMAMMQCIFSIGSVVLQRAINGLGQIAVSYIITAHTAARKIINIMMMPLSTVASATFTFVSQNWGAGKAERVRTTLKKSLLMEVAWGIFAALVVYALGGHLIRWMTGTADEEVLKNAVMNLRVNFTFYPFLGVLICLRMAMQVMGQKLAPLFASGLELAIKVIFSLWVIPGRGYFEASLTEPLTWLLCMALLMGIFMATRRRTFARCPVQKGAACEAA